MVADNICVRERRSARSSVNRRRAASALRSARVGASVAHLPSQQQLGRSRRTAASLTMAYNFVSRAFGASATIDPDLGFASEDSTQSPGSAGLA